MYRRLSCLRLHTSLLPSHKTVQHKTIHHKTIEKPPQFTSPHRSNSPSPHRSNSPPPSRMANRHHGLLALLRLRSRAAAAAARASAAPRHHSPPLLAPAAPHHPAPPRGLLGDALAAFRVEAAQGAAAYLLRAQRQAAAGKPLHGDGKLPASLPRRLVCDAVAAARARARAALADFLRAIHGRISTIHGEARAALSCYLRAMHARIRTMHGEARAVAMVYFLRAQQRGQAAKAIAGKRILHTSDATIRNARLVLFGQSAPVLKSPTLFLMQYTLHMSKKVSMVLQTIKWFLKLDADEKAALLAWLAAPFAVLTFIIPSETVSSAPETICPIVDVYVLELDGNARECLMALFSLCYKCACYVVMFAGGPVISLLEMIKSEEVKEDGIDWLRDLPMLDAATSIMDVEVKDIDGLQDLTRKEKIPDEIPWTANNKEMLEGKADPP